MAAKRVNQDSERLLREAAEWFVRVQGEEVSTEDFSAWQHWLAGSPAHREAFQQVEEFWQSSGQLTNPPWPSAVELSVDRSFSGKAKLWTGVALATAAAAAFAVFTLNIFTGTLSNSAAIKTVSAEQRTLTLKDGSTVVIGAQTRVTVDFTATARNLIIDSGEAFFTVARDPTRPFTVRAGNGTITAIGTAFNVQHLGGRVVVTVVEGTVDVTDIRSAPSPSATARTIKRSTTRVKAGHEIAYGSAPTPVQAVDVGIATAWRSGRLKYRNEPLKFVVPNIARYTQRQLIIADPEVGEMHYTGTILPAEVDDWLASIGDAFPVDIVRLNAETVLLKAREAGR